MPAVKGVGEPGAGEPHARFDGRELEKELLRLPVKAALGKPWDLSPVRPTARHLASSLPDQPLKTEYHLYVGGRDRTKIVDGLGWQVEAVRAALGGADVPVHAALCFIEAEWKLFAKPFQHDGVWVVWAAKLAEMIGAPGPLTLIDVTNVADRLAMALPPAVPTTAIARPV
jgi:hypothetical protein